MADSYIVSLEALPIASTEGGQIFRNLLIGWWFELSFKGSETLHAVDEKSNNEPQLFQNYMYEIDIVICSSTYLIEMLPQVAPVPGPINKARYIFGIA